MNPDLAREQAAADGLVAGERLPIAAFRLRQQRYISANIVPIHEHSVEFVRIVWEEIERQMHE